MRETKIVKLYRTSVPAPENPARLLVPPGSELLTVTPDGCQTLMVWFLEDVTMTHPVTEPVHIAVYAANQQINVPDGQELEFVTHKNLGPNLDAFVFTLTKLPDADDGDDADRKPEPGTSDPAEGGGSEPANTTQADGGAEG